MKLPSWLMLNVFRLIPLVSHSGAPLQENPEPETIVHPMDANVITSQQVDSDKHLIMLDLDVEHVYIPSSTEGHGHLIFGKPVSFEEYCSLLELMSSIGLIEVGYWKATVARSYGSLRLPHIKKGSE